MKISTKYLASAMLSVGFLVSAGSLSAQSSGFMSAGSGGSAPSNKPAASTASTIPPVHPFSTAIHNGILTVDGMVGKAQLNYDVHQQGFLYFTVPGVGTAIVAQTRFMNALPQKGAFHGNELTIQVNGHTVELTNSGPMVAGKAAEAWVAIDPLFGANLEFPQMGYGDTLQRPYVWPGSKAEHSSANANASAPPLPSNLRPKPEVSSTYTVTVPAADPSSKQ